MIKKSAFIFIISLTLGCAESSFVEDSSTGVHHSPTNLRYAEIINAREQSFIKSSVPTVESGGEVCFFEILNVRNDNNTILDDTYMDFATIANPIPDTIIIDVADENIAHVGDSTVIIPTYNRSNAGQITIASGHNFTIGDYYFTIKVQSVKDEDTLTTIFIDNFHLNIMSLLPSYLLYIPTKQNLVENDQAATTAPTIDGTQDCSFAFTNKRYSDTLDINTKTGAITLSSNYSLSGIDTFQVNIDVISNTSQERITFNKAITIYASENPIIIPKKEFVFFYPTLESESSVYGAQRFIVDDGGLSDISKIFKPVNTCGGYHNGKPKVDLCTIITEERPQNIKGLEVYPFKSNNPKAYYPSKAWIVMNSYNLKLLSLSYENFLATFYMYQAGSGTTDNSAGFDVYVSSNYDDDFKTANWELVSDEVTHRLYDNGVFGEEHSGMPGYRTVQEEWVKCQLDLTPFQDWENLTLGIYYSTSHSVPIYPGTGRFTISDITYRATER